MQNFMRIGNSYQLLITVKNIDGSLKDLSNVSEIVYQLAKTVNSNDSYITKRLTLNEIEIPNPTNGVVVIKLESNDTLLVPSGAFHHEALMCDSLGEVITILSEDSEMKNQLIKGC